MFVAGWIYDLLCVRVGSLASLLANCVDIYLCTFAFDIKLLVTCGCLGLNACLVVLLGVCWYACFCSFGVVCVSIFVVGVWIWCVCCFNSVG